MTTNTNLQNWRESIRLFGREFTIMEDMIQLGFLKVEPKELEEMKAVMKQIRKLEKENWKVRQELGKIGDLKELLAKVRKFRIERVRKERFMVVLS